jgi:hypothetical protein
MRDAQNQCLMTVRRQTALVKAKYQISDFIFAESRGEAKHNA